MAAFFLVAVLPVGAVGFLAYRQGEATLRAQFFTHLSSVAELKNQQIEGWLRERRHDVVRPASIPNVKRLALILTAGAHDPKRRAAAEELREILNRIRTLSGFAEMFLVEARDGEVLLSTDPEQEGKFKSDRPYVREGRKGPFLQHVYYSLIHGKAVMAFSAPITGPRAGPVAILVGRVDLAFLDRLMAERSGMGSSGRTFLVNRFNYFVSESLGRGPYGWRPVFSEGVKRVLAGETGTALYPNDEQRAVVGAHRWLPEIGLGLVAEVDQDEAFEPIRRFRLALVVVLGLVGAVAIVLGVGFSYGISRPIGRVVAAVRAFGRGDLSHRVEIARPGELAFLASAVNQMADDLSRSRRELEAYSQTLEQRVEERTRQSEARRRIAEAVAEVGRVLTQTRDRQTVSDTVVNTVSRLYGAESASLFWLDQASGALVAWATTGMSARMAIEGSIPAGTGVVGLAVRERRPVTTANLLSDPRITLAPQQREGIERASYRSVLAVPLLVRGDVVGALGLGNHEGRVFTAEEIQAAQTFADQAALALECARLYESSERRRREAEGLAQAARALTASLDASTVAERTVAQVLPLFNAPYAQLRLLRPDGSLEVIAVTSDHAEIAPVGHVLPPGMGVTGLCVRERRPVAVPNLFEDPAVELPVELRAAMVQASLGAVLTVPLIVEDEILGALAVLDRPGRVFSSHETQLVQAFADQAAVALNNARMLQALTVHQGRLEALLESSRRLGHIQPVESLLSAIAEACGRLLDSRSVGFRLVEGDELVVAGTWGDATDMMLTPRLKFGESLSGIVAATGEVLVVQDPGADPRMIPAHREVVRRSGYRAFLGVPVKLGERTLGVLGVYSRHAHGFTEEDVALATAFAAHAAIALENARLFQDLRRAYDELSQTQGQLLHAQKMEAVGRLAGGIAHDFNNLLTVIIGRAQLLMQHLTAADLPRQDIELIENTARRGASLTKQLLAFSRKQILQPRPVNLSELVAELLPMLRPLLGEDVEIVAELAPRLGTAMVDPAQFQQIVVNLAVNARDAMPPAGGRLALQTAEIELDEPFVRRNPGSAPGPHVMLTASDTGAGMTPDVLAHLFEPFFTTKPAGEGTGLGLSTVHGIVQQHGGYIAVESQPARGTTFKIYFPRIEVAAQAEDAEQSTGLGVADGSGTVLVVEDEPDLRDLIREILEAHGYETVQASDAAEALRLAERHHGPIHLLLTDVVMPGSNGRQLAERLVALRPDTKVLYMSGYTDDRLVRSGVLGQGLRLVQKPFAPDDLLRQVREVLHPA